MDRPRIVRWRRRAILGSIYGVLFLAVVAFYFTSLTKDRQLANQRLLEISGIARDQLDLGHADVASLLAMEALHGKSSKSKKQLAEEILLTSNRQIKRYGAVTSLSQRKGKILEVEFDQQDRFALILRSDFSVTMMDTVTGAEIFRGEYDQFDEVDLSIIQGNVSGPGGDKAVWFLVTGYVSERSSNFLIYRCEGLDYNSDLMMTSLAGGAGDTGKCKKVVSESVPVVGVNLDGPKVSLSNITSAPGGENDKFDGVILNIDAGGLSNKDNAFFSVANAWTITNRPQDPQLSKSAELKAGQSDGTSEPTLSMPQEKNIWRVDFASGASSFYSDTFDPDLTPALDLIAFATQLEVFFRDELVSLIKERDTSSIMSVEELEELDRKIAEMETYFSESMAEIKLLFAELYQDPENGSRFRNYAEREVLASVSLPGSGQTIAITNDDHMSLVVWDKLEPKREDEQGIQLPSAANYGFAGTPLELLNNSSTLKLYAAPDGKEIAVVGGDTVAFFVLIEEQVGGDFRYRFSTPKIYEFNSGITAFAFGKRSELNRAIFEAEAAESGMVEAVVHHPVAVALRDGSILAGYVDSEGRPDSLCFFENCTNPTEPGPPREVKVEKAFERVNARQFAEDVSHLSFYQRTDEKNRSETALLVNSRGYIRAFGNWENETAVFGNGTWVSRGDTDRRARTRVADMRTQKLDDQARLLSINSDGSILLRDLEAFFTRGLETASRLYADIATEKNDPDANVTATSSCPAQSGFPELVTAPTVTRGNYILAVFGSSILKFKKKSDDTPEWSLQSCWKPPFDSPAADNATDQEDVELDISFLGFDGPNGSEVLLFASGSRWGFIKESSIEGVLPDLGSSGPKAVTDRATYCPKRACSSDKEITDIDFVSRDLFLVSYGRARNQQPQASGEVEKVVAWSRKQQAKDASSGSKPSDTWERMEVWSAGANGTDGDLRLLDTIVSEQQGMVFFSLSNGSVCSFHTKLKLDRPDCKMVAKTLAESTGQFRQPTSSVANQFNPPGLQKSFRDLGGPGDRMLGMSLKYGLPENTPKADANAKKAKSPAKWSTAKFYEHPSRGIYLLTGPEAGGLNFRSIQSCEERGFFAELMRFEKKVDYIEVQRDGSVVLSIPERFRARTFIRTKNVIKDKINYVPPFQSTLPNLLKDFRECKAENTYRQNMTVVEDHTDRISLEFDEVYLEDIRAFSSDPENSDIISVGDRKGVRTYTISGGNLLWAKRIRASQASVLDVSYSSKRKEDKRSEILAVTQGGIFVIQGYENGQNLEKTKCEALPSWRRHLTKVEANRLAVPLRPLSIPQAMIANVQGLFAGITDYWGQVFAPERQGGIGEVIEALGESVVSIGQQNRRMESLDQRGQGLCRQNQ